MHCAMCSEKNPCPDCLIDEIKHRRIQRYATQGGGIAVANQFGGYMFEEVPDWGTFEVGDIVPSDWSLVPISN